MTSGRMWRPPGAMVGGGASYRQLRSLRSLASGYGYVALRAVNAACGFMALLFQPFTQRQEFFNLRNDAFLFGKRGERDKCFFYLLKIKIRLRCTLSFFP